MKRRSILIALGAIIIITLIAGWKYINQPSDKVEDIKGIAITAVDLTQEYSSNETSSNNKYLNKALEVTGRVVEVSKNQDGKTVLLLEAEDPMSGVQCTLRDNEVVTEGSEITVKGFCTGYTLVVLLSEGILL